MASQLCLASRDALVHKEKAPPSMSWARVGPTVLSTLCAWGDHPCPSKTEKSRRKTKKRRQHRLQPRPYLTEPTLPAGWHCHLSLLPAVVSRGRPSMLGRALRNVPDPSDLCHLLYTPETSELQTLWTFHIPKLWLLESQTCFSHANLRTHAAGHMLRSGHACMPKHT